MNRPKRCKNGGTARPALPCSLCYGRKPRAQARFGCCSSSVVEHSLGKGEVESSILSCSTTFLQHYQDLAEGPLPFPPGLDRERSPNLPQLLGESWGKPFAGCSARFRAGQKPLIFPTEKDSGLARDGPTGAHNEKPRPLAKVGALNRLSGYDRLPYRQHARPSPTLDSRQERDRAHGHGQG